MKPRLLVPAIAACAALLACVGALGVVTQARAQTVTPRLGTPPFARDGLTRETAPTLYDAPDFQRPVGFEPPDRRGLDRFHLLAAAERGRVAVAARRRNPPDTAHAGRAVARPEIPVAIEGQAIGAGHAGRESYAGVERAVLFAWRRLEALDVDAVGQHVDSLRRNAARDQSVLHVVGRHENAVGVA